MQSGHCPPWWWIVMPICCSSSQQVFQYWAGKTQRERVVLYSPFLFPTFLLSHFSPHFPSPHFLPFLPLLCFSGAVFFPLTSFHVFVTFIFVFLLYLFAWIFFFFASVSPCFMFLIFSYLPHCLFSLSASLSFPSHSTLFLLFLLSLYSLTQTVVSAITTRNKR